MKALINEVLRKKPSQVFIDGNKIPNLKNYNLRAIVKGDQKIPAISAASIIAKVTRDKFIKTLAKKNKGYYWDQNFGYGTKQHLKAIKKLGVNKHYRKTFSPISKFKKYNIDGYIIPKNNEFFSEYAANDRLKTISNFSGSAGYSIILKKKNYLFVDGRYTIQAKKEAGKNFQIID